jgi:NAD(P)-dependent dehydrogenase (short-subunit alcohol dehydrogenase family)
MRARPDAPAVVITGASAGVGRAVAVAFARRGWRVGLLARGRDRLDAAAREVEAAGGTALVLQADVADADAVEAAARDARAGFGRLDAWVNNAMATVYSPVREVAPEEVRRVTEVTYLGQVHGTLAALRHLEPDGTIVQIGSALAYRSIPLQSAYCAAKAAVRGFTDSLRSELIREGSGIRLTMVQLPAVNTPQFDWARSRMPRRLQPVPPIFAPESVAEEIVRAAYEAPREWWVGTPAMEAILGTFVAPGYLDARMARDAWPGQMTDEPARPHADNLFEAPPGDPGTRGRFSEQASGSVTAWSDTGARRALGGLALGGALAAVALGWAARGWAAPNPRRRALAPGHHRAEEAVRRYGTELHPQ